MDIERIEEWLGQTVVDRDGEKIGKLEDVFYGSGSGDAVAASVKTGLLGRSLSLVPLTGATVGRDHIRVECSKDQVKDAPQVESGADVGEGDRGRLAEHFEATLPAGSLESGNARAERERRAEEAAARARDLEKVAEERAGEADAKASEAEERRERADAAARERDEAQREAEQARRDAGGGAA